MTTIPVNPDPEKYAFCVGGIQLKPRFCKVHKVLFTPKNENQIGCDLCEPDAKEVKVECVIHEIIRGKVAPNPEYALNYRRCKGRASSKIANASKENVGKWQDVYANLRKLYRERKPIDYDDVVESVFGFKIEKHKKTYKGHKAKQ